jgi:hypothetical protein
VADKSKIKDQAEFNRLQAEAAALAAQQVAEARAYNIELKELLGIKTRVNDDDKELLSISGRITESVKQNNTLLRRSGELNSRIIKDRRLQADFERELLAFQNDNLNTYKAIEYRAEKLKNLAQQSADLERKRSEALYKGNKQEAEDLKRQLALKENEQKKAYESATIEVKKLAILKAGKQALDDSIKRRQEELKFSHEVNKNMGITGALLDNLDKIGVRFLGGIGLNFGVFKEAIAEGQQNMQRVAEQYAELNILQKKFSETPTNSEEYEKLRNNLSEVGVEIARSLGGDTLKELEELLNDGDQTKIRDFGIRIAEANVGLDGMTIKFRALKQALPGIKKAFLEALFDPLAPALIGLKLAGGLINLMTKNFGDLDKATVDFRRLTGESSSVLAGMNDRLATSVDVLEIMSALSKEIGTNAMAIFGPDELGALAEARNLLGLSVEQTSMLGLLSKSTGMSIDGFQDSFSAAAQQANALGNSAIPASIAFGDILNTSKDISLSLGNNPQALAKAAVAARALGVDLKKLDNIASSLLDFESSIEAELEAQLLTGKAINLAKAREFALNNDLAGLAGELAKNGASASEFANMNRIQQESIAKALGMSREELANSIIAQDTQNQLTEDQKAKIRGVTLEQSKSMTVQEEINKSLQKLAQAFLPIVQAIIPIVTALTPIVGIIAKAVSSVLNLFGVFTETKEKAEEVHVAIKALGITLLTVAGIFVLFKGAAMIGSVVGAFRNLKGAISAAGGPLKALGTGIMNTFRGAAGMAPKVASTVAGTAGAVTPTAGASAASRAAKIAQKVNPAAGVGVRKFLTDLSRGLTAMSLPGVPIGTAALTAASGAIRTAAINTRTVTPAAGTRVQGFLRSLSQGLVSMVKAGPGVAVLTKTALAFTLMTLAIPTMAFIGAFGPAVGVGLKSIGTGIAALGKAGPAAMKGILILAGIGLALIPLTYALSLLAPLLKEVFTGFNNLLDGLTMDRLVGLYALGPALMVAASGLTAFAAAMTLGGLGAGLTNFLTGGGLLGQLDTLAQMAQPLAGVGASLMAISAGLQAVADATEKIEIEKIKELDGLITSTAAAAPFVVATKAIGDIIGNITGKQETTTTSPSNDKLINKIDELISIVKKGGNVYMDGNKVGQAIVLAGTKSS